MPPAPYLQPANYEVVRDRVSRITWRHVNFTDHLREQADACLDRYILLDAQDWMSDEQLTDLWQADHPHGPPGARVLFRTAAEETLLPGRVPDAILSRWDYSEAEARDLIRADRSSIYGGLHLYRFKG
jgi:S-adenosylmethionine-diacylglycerol 3-amino-3-carboxypropyl transferase